MFTRNDLKKLWCEFVDLSSTGVETEKSMKLEDELEAKLIEEADKNGFIEADAVNEDCFSYFDPSQVNNIDDNLKQRLLKKSDSNVNKRRLRDGRYACVSEEFYKSVVEPLEMQIQIEREFGRDQMRDEFDTHEFEALRIVLAIKEEGKIISDEEKDKLLSSEFWDEDIFTIENINYELEDFPSIFFCTGKCVCGIDGQLDTEKNEFEIVKNTSLSGLTKYLQSPYPVVSELAKMRIEGRWE